jgi:chemotaxis response regulator CheB
MLIHDPEASSNPEEKNSPEEIVVDGPKMTDLLDAEGPVQEAQSSQEPGLEEVVAAAEVRLRELMMQLDAVRIGVQRGRARVEAELQVERRRAANAEERIRQMEAARQEVLDALEEQRITGAELTTVLRAAEYRLADLEKNVEARDAQISALRESQAGEAEHARSLRSQIESLAEGSREVAADRDRFKETLLAAENERAFLARELKNQKRRLTRREEDVERLRAELKEAREWAAAKAPDTGPGGRNLAELDGALVVARQRVEAQAEELRRAQARIEELEDSLGKEHAQGRVLQQSLTQRQAEVEERARACETLIHENSELKTAINALRLESEQAGRDLADAQQMREQGGERRSLMEARIGDLERALQASQEHETILQATVAELQEVLQNEQTASSLLRAETQNRERLRQTLERELLEARARWSELEARQQAQVQQHLLELAKSNERSRMLEVDRDNLQEQVVNIAAARDRLERECEQLRRRVEMEKQKSEMARLQAKLEEVELRHPEAMGNTRAEGGPRLPSAMRLETPASSVVAAALPTADLMPDGVVIVAIGASTGGPAVLSSLLPQFPPEVQACFLIIQHMPPGYTAELASCLAQQTRIKVAEARHGDPLMPGVAYVAPGGHHMEVQGGRIRLTSGLPVNKHRPSVDVLFASLVPLAKRVYAVLLSGMGNDGVAGMSRLHTAGAETLVQDEASSVVWGMPGAAVKAGCANQQLSPKDLGNYLVARTIPQEWDEESDMAAAPARTDGATG